MVRKPQLRERGRRGAAMTETAITLSVLLTLTFGVIEFGYAFYCQNVLAGAARDGARAGMVPNGSYTSVTTAVTTALASTHWPSSYYTVTVTDMSGNSLASDLSTEPQGTEFQVTVSVNWSTVGAGFSPLHLLGSTKVLRGSSVMRKE